MMKFLMILFVSYHISPFYVISTVNADAEMINSPPKCRFSAIYNFGDSNSDTGGIAAAFLPSRPPSGETFFRRPAGRASDGRLIIDFIAEKLGFPYLSSYLDSLGSKYRRGANFATAGATVLRSNESWFVSGTSPFPLEIQVEQYIQFKDRSAYLYEHSNDLCVRGGLPRPEQESKALFTVDIGQTDVAFGIQPLKEELRPAAISKVVKEFISQVKALYKGGARNFWIHNVGPNGCLPVAVLKLQKLAPPGSVDDFGCLKEPNDVVQKFNKALENKIVELRTHLSGATIVYVDIYAAKYQLITTAKSQGFEDPFTTCCGYHGIDYDIQCGTNGTVDGRKVFADSCSHPSKVISWDGIHYTEAANKWTANRILSGSFSDPPYTRITDACNKTT